MSRKCNPIFLSIEMNYSYFSPDFLSFGLFCVGWGLGGVCVFVCLFVFVFSVTRKITNASAYSL